MVIKELIKLNFLFRGAYFPGAGLGNKWKPDFPKKHPWVPFSGIHFLPVRIWQRTKAALSHSKALKNCIEIKTL